MTTFGVDFQKHLDATKREDIPIIMEKCITEIDLRCLHLKVGPDFCVSLKCLLPLSLNRGLWPACHQL